jgi:hypothetical protein
VGHLQVTKIYIEENYTEYDHSIDLVDGWIIHVELKVPLLSRVYDLFESLEYAPIL